MEIKDKTLEEATEVEMDLGSLFEGTEISEEVRGKVKTIFEAVVTAKVNEQVETKVTALQEEYEAKFVEQLDEVKSELVEKIDTFLNYAVNEWVEQNKVAIESGIRNEITENFINGLKDLFLENYIEVPEEKFDLIGEMEAEMAELKESMNAEIAKTIDANKKIAVLVKESVIAEVTKGLTETDAEKIKGLAEGVEFTTESEFKEKVLTLKENFFPKNAPLKDGLNEETHEEVTKIVHPSVEKYVQALSRM
jgi:hypothetical protein